MAFTGISYLEWARTNIVHPPKYPIDLANSALPSPTMDELGLSIKDLTLEGGTSFGLPPLIDMIAAHNKTHYKNVLITPGTNMAIFLCLAALVEPGDEVLLEAPNYEPFFRTIEHLGTEMVTLDRNFDTEFELDLEVVQRKISRRTKAIIVTNMHNPSGVSIGAEKLRALGQIARQNNCWVICDEIYKDIVFEGDPPPAAFTLGERMITMSSFSKVFGLGAIRLGWMLCDEHVQEKIRKIENYFMATNPLPSEKFLLAGFKRRAELLKKARDIVLPNFKLLTEWFSKRDDTRLVVPHGGTVCFPKLPKGMDSGEFVSHLAKDYGTLVVPGDFFWAKGFVRMSFCAPGPEFAKGLENFGKAIDDLSKRRK